MVGLTLITAACGGENTDFVGRPIPAASATPTRVSQTSSVSIEPTQTPILAPDIESDISPTAEATPFSETSSTAVSREATPTAQVEEHTDFNSLRQKITESAEIVDSEKQNLLIIADELEANYRVLKEFEASPLLAELINLRVEALGPLDPSPLYPGLSTDAAKRQWVLDNDLFYLHDLRLIGETLEKTEDLPPSAPGAPSALSGVLRNAEMRIRKTPYTHDKVSPEIEIETAGIEASEELKQKILKEALEMPIPGHTRIILTTKAAIEGEKADMVNGLEIHATADSPTIIKIAADIPEEERQRALRHEIHRALDPFANNKAFILAFSSDELIKMQIAATKLSLKEMQTSADLALIRLERGEPLEKVLKELAETENTIRTDELDLHGDEVGTGAYEYLGLLTQNLPNPGLG